MYLAREHWTIFDGEEFKKYLLTFSKGAEKSAWEKRIINTSLDCIAVDSKKLNEIAKQIAKGNFLEFLNLKLRDNYSLFALNGMLISKIKDLEIMKSFLDDYANNCDNWACCDILKFPISKNKKLFFEWAKEYIVSDKTFIKRIGIRILFGYVKDEEYLPEIFNILNSFKEETQYYVNMANAWLVCELFTKHRNATLKFLQNNNLNDFTINKAIQKCRDSFRVSQEDKKLLLNFKR